MAPPPAPRGARPMSAWPLATRRSAPRIQARSFGIWRRLGLWTGDWGAGLLRSWFRALAQAARGAGGLVSLSSIIRSLRKLSCCQKTGPGTNTVATGVHAPWMVGAYLRVGFAGGCPFGEGRDLIILGVARRYAAFCGQTRRASYKSQRRRTGSSAGWTRGETTRARALTLACEGGVSHYK